MTKTVPPERLREAFEAGVRDFGENRVQELLAKKPQLPGEIRWHFQGRLQTNKVKSLLGEITLLHSLDRIALTDEIQKQAEKKNIQVDVLVQVNTSGEATKSGFAPEEVEEAVEKIIHFDRIRVKGLMTIGPMPNAMTHASTAQTRECFRKLRLLREKIEKLLQPLTPTLSPSRGEGRVRGQDHRHLHLSMGMSADFEAAIEEGATIVRIGTAVFGKREYAAQ